LYPAINSPVGSLVASEVADSYDISRAHLLKLVRCLGRGGFIRTYRGRNGGITLARAARDISIGAVVRYSEGEPRLVECFRQQGACKIDGLCMLASILRKAGENFFDTLEQYTLADVLVEAKELQRRLSNSSPAVQTTQGQ